MVGMDTSVAILENLDKSNDRFYTPLSLKDALSKNVLGKKIKKQ